MTLVQRGRVQCVHQEVEIAGGHPGGCLSPHPRVKVLHRKTQCSKAVGGCASTHKILIMPDFWGSPGEPEGAPTGIVNRNERPRFHVFTECSLGKTHTKNNSDYP